MGERAKNPVVKAIQQKAKKKPGPKRAPRTLEDIEEMDKPRKLGMGPGKLSIKQLRFCQEYVANGGNATQAAIYADYTEKSAHDTGSKLIKRPEVVQKIVEIEKQHLAKVEMTAEYKYKLLKKSADALENAIDLEDKPSTIKTLVAVLAESSKMAGHYAPDRTINKNVHGLTDNLDEIDKMMDEYEREY